MVGAWGGEGLRALAVLGIAGLLGAGLTGCSAASPPPPEADRPATPRVAAGASSADAAVVAAPAREPVEAAPALDGGTAEVDELAGLPAVEITRSTPPDDFRARVVYQMQQLIGHDVRRLQDAINAAYLSAGWQGGRDATAAEDRRARAQARAWGFYLRSFLARGRGQPFGADDLADGPLAEPKTSAPRGWVLRRTAWRPLQATAPAPALASSPTAAVERQRGAAADLDQRALRLDAELGALEHAVGEINEQLARNERWIRSHGQRAPAARAAAQNLVQSAERAIGATEATLLQQTRRLEALRRESAGGGGDAATAKPPASR